MFKVLVFHSVHPGPIYLFSEANVSDFHGVAFFLGLRNCFIFPLSATFLIKQYPWKITSVAKLACACTMGEPQWYIYTKEAMSVEINKTKANLCSLSWLSVNVTLVH